MPGLWRPCGSPQVIRPILHSELFGDTQDLAGLLADAPLLVAVRCVSLLQLICKLPQPNKSSTMMYDQHICRSLLHNKAVADPLMRFVVANSSIAPGTDIEWVGNEGFRVFAILLKVTGIDNFFVGPLSGQASNR